MGLLRIPGTCVWFKVDDAWVVNLMVPSHIAGTDVDPNASDKRQLVQMFERSTKHVLSIIKDNA
jgi:hypothetical protein